MIAEQPDESPILRRLAFFISAQNAEIKSFTCGKSMSYYPH
ncbi:hypothetical protein SJA_C1-29510 [Sphingobium indicum UT26S]|uniref:Uncharacterized protein n=2 Tax=Sphingomonadaceae TaxID=41297 RepID=D4Z5A3_SPHIU|nr:hypothetical protein SJA_C1-29510 [Sphingobium indicum UT26S]